MESGIFITDNRLKFSQILAGNLRDRGIKVCLSSESKTEGQISSTDVEWNRTSLFSLQSIILQLKNINLIADTSIIIFDAIDYAKIYSNSDILSIDKTISDLVSANLALSHMLKNFYTKKAQGRLIFVHRGVESPCGHSSVAAASASFIKIAEETVDAMRKTDLPGVQTLLVKLEGSEDSNFADWISTQLEMPVLTKNPGRWIKAGQRGFFSK